jgi:hypothetical protein
MSPISFLDRPNTQWKPCLITNVRFCLYHLNYTLGRGGVRLADYTKNARSIVSLEKALIFFGAYR